ncbi:hypothetical protein ABBQ38_012632 [Trebouxia sp. C0009 RCD-2024]
MLLECPITIVLKFVCFNLCTPLPWSRATSAAEQLAYQITAKCPNLHRFRYFGWSSVKADVQEALSMATVAEISKGNWSSLTSVSLQQCRLGSQGLSILVQADWPGLQHLDVSRNCIDAGGMALLAKGNWPLLTQLGLSSNHSIDAVAIAHLSATKWPLEELRLGRMLITAAGAAELAKLQLPRLANISLCGAGLTAAAMSGLAEAEWLRLSSLSISFNNLDAAAMQHLFRMQLPALELLDLTHANLTEEGAYWLALGRWPLLSILNLSDNKLNAKGVEHITSGVWPNLQCLSLDGNPIGDGGAQQLTKGDWPLLHRLTVGLGMLEMRHSAVCLGLDSDKVQGLKCDTIHLVMYLERNVSQDSVSLRPDLRKVVVVKC